MFQFWGDGSQAAMDLVDNISVCSTDNFNWTFIFILAVVYTLLEGNSSKGETVKLFAFSTYISYICGEFFS